MQKHVRNEKISASKINSLPLHVHEEIIESSSSSGFNFFIPTAVVAPVCDGNICQAIDAFWRESSLLSSAYNFIHSGKEAEIAANGISTALAAYNSIKTVLDYGSGVVLHRYLASGILVFIIPSLDSTRRAILQLARRLWLKTA